MVKSFVLNGKKYIQYSEKFQGKLCFQGKRKFKKNPECKKYIQYSEKFQGNSVFFRTSASCSKIVNGEKMFNTVYIYLGSIHAIWASVVCNLDQSHDWLHGRNLVGKTGDVSPHFFRWEDIICHVPQLFSRKGLYLERFQK